MKQIKIADTTLCAEEGVFGFKEKLEIARQLEKLNVDVIELPENRVLYGKKQRFVCGLR